MSIEPIATSTLGPIRVDMNSDRIQAKLTREAIASLLGHANRHESRAVYSAVHVIATEGSDALLAKLKRLLK